MTFKGTSNTKREEGCKPSKENNPAEALSSGAMSLDALPIADLTANGSMAPAEWQWQSRCEATYSCLIFLTYFKFILFCSVVCHLINSLKSFCNKPEYK